MNDSKVGIIVYLHFKIIFKQVALLFTSTKLIFTVHYPYEIVMKNENETMSSITDYMMEGFTNLALAQKFSSPAGMSPFQGIH